MENKQRILTVLRRHLYQSTHDKWLVKTIQKTMKRVRVLNPIDYNHDISLNILLSNLWMSGVKIDF